MPSASHYRRFWHLPVRQCTIWSRLNSGKEKCSQTVSKQGSVGPIPVDYKVMGRYELRGVSTTNQFLQFDAKNLSHTVRQCLQVWTHYEWRRPALDGSGTALWRKCSSRSTSCTEWVQQQHSSCNTTTNASEHFIAILYHGKQSLARPRHVDANATRPLLRRMPLLIKKAAAVALLHDQPTPKQSAWPYG